MHLIYCPCSNQTAAKALAKALLAEGLAVCVNIIPSVTSLYPAEGAVVEGSEAVMVIKTLKSEAVSRYLIQHHPYDVPAILSIPVEGNEAFRQWAEKL